MTKKQTLLVLLTAAALVTVPSMAVAQQDGNGEGGNERTVEELFLESVEMQLIGEQVRSTDRSMKMEALNSLEKMVDEGEISENDSEAIFLLDRLSGEGINVVYREEGRVVNNYPMVRKRAAKILGKIGGAQSRDALINILLSDNEPMVQAEAAYALGELNIANDRQALQALSNTILQQDILTPDNNLAFATMLAFEKIAQSSGAIQEPSVFRALVRIRSGNYNPTVREKALQIMNSIIENN